MRARWYRNKQTGSLHCAHCRKPASDKSRGPSHSHCWVDPSPSFGSPEACDEPLKVARRDARLTGAMASHIFRNMRKAEIDRMLQDLRNYNEWYFSALMASAEGERMSAYAEREGIAASTARWRKYQALNFVRAWCYEQWTAVQARKQADADAWLLRNPETQAA